MKNLLPGEGTDEARERLRPIAQWPYLSAMGGLLGSDGHRRRTSLP